MKFRIILKEVLGGAIDIEAEDEVVAWATAKRLIKNNEIPRGAMDYSEGYEILSVEPPCKTCKDGDGWLYRGEYDNVEVVNCPECNPDGKADGDDLDA